MAPTYLIETHCTMLVGSNPSKKTQRLLHNLIIDQSTNEQPQNQSNKTNQTKKIRRTKNYQRWIIHKNTEKKIHTPTSVGTTPP